jgi:hypothetical protein
MASRNLTLRAGGAAGKSDTIYTDLSTSFKLGTRAWDDQGNEYVFIKGVSSGAANDVVVIDEDYGTTRLAPDEVGPVGVLDAAIDATTKGGWAQVYGVAPTVASDTTAADKALFIDTAAGRIDDAAVAGDVIVGMYSMTTDTYTGAANLTKCWLSYPHVSDLTGYTS